MAEDLDLLPQTASHKKQVLRSASLIGVITVISRILGYVRDQRLTLLLGTSRLADAFVLAYRIPNALRRLVGEGSMTAAFVPVFIDHLKNRREEEAWEFANRVFWTVAAFLAIVTLLGVIFSPLVVRMFSLFANHEVQIEAISLNRLMFPYVLFIGLAALCMGILASLHVFGPPAATPIFLNISFIVFSIGAVWKHFSSPAAALAVGVLIGGILQFLFQLPQLKRRGMTFKFGISFSDPGIRRLARLMIPGFFGMGIAQINLLVDTVFANARQMPEGSLLSLYVADRVTELVLGVYAAAVATVILTMMSHQAAAGDYGSLKRTLGFALRIVSFITIPAAVGLVVMREPIVQVLFQHGKFVAESTHLTARALLYYSMGLPAFAVVKLIVAAFYSTQDTRTPVRVALITLVANIVFNTIFLFYFFSRFQNGGPALASTLAAYIDVAILFVIFRVRLGAFATREVLRSVWKIVLSAAVMGALCWTALHYSEFNLIEHVLPRMAVFIGLIGGAALCYLGFAWLLRCEELWEVYAMVVRPRAAEQGSL